MSWPEVSNGAELPSPALLVFRERMEENLRLMVEVAGGPERLRPHIKTHKLPQLIWRQLDLGISKFKCATIAEAEMAALSGAPDILLAGQPVGANALRFAQLIARFPQTKFLTLTDEEGAAEALGAAAVEAGVTVETLVDLDVGQRRTGLPADERAAALYEKLAQIDGLAPGGLHAYDGHLTQTNLEERKTACDAAFLPVEHLRAALLAKGLPVPRVVAGGSPTFAIHAARGNVECSPGTCVFWDAGYSKKLPDLPFQPAAALFCRVVSKPAAGLLCLDLGHKAVASEMPHPRVVFPALPDAAPQIHNEEHLVIQTARAGEYAVGDAILGIPWHICPTVALHSEVWVVEAGAAVECWPVAGRARRLTI